MLLPAVVDSAERLLPWACSFRIFDAKAVGADAEFLAPPKSSRLSKFRVAALLRLVFPRIANKAAWSRSWWMGSHGVLELGCAVPSVVEVSCQVVVVGNAVKQRVVSQQTALDTADWGLAEDTGVSLVSVHQTLCADVVFSLHGFAL